MFLPRLIPVLLLNDDHLVKSMNFKKFNYIGDPIHAVHIFNNLEVDEIVILDITARKENRKISYNLIKQITEEANMPCSVGGNINTIDEIRDLISLGVEKVVLNTSIIEQTNFVSEAVYHFGSSTIMACVDVKSSLFGKKNVYINAGKTNTGLDPIQYVKKLEEFGIGEVIVQSIDRDGLRKGYDIDLISKISQNVTVPIIALGGAGTLSDLKKVYIDGYATAIAAGSLFVYQGTGNGVLINYPEKEEIYRLFK